MQADLQLGSVVADAAWHNRVHLLRLIMPPMRPPAVTQRSQRCCCVCVALQIASTCFVCKVKLCTPLNI